MKVKDALAGSHGLCPFCKGPIIVPQPSQHTALGVMTLETSKVDVAPPPHANTGETTIYSDRDVTVTTSRIICGSTTYALRNITSVKLSVAEANRHAGLLFMALGVVLVILGAIGFDLRGSERFGAFFAGLVFAIPGYAHWRHASNDYHLAIAVSSGEVQAFTSKNRQQVEKIVAAVNEAIIRCR